MSDVKWTAAQLDAINSRGSSLLVSAAAGSGKTATLTERIIRSLTDHGTNISEMLIVTFTRAAVSELRSRIAAALNAASIENPALRRQIYLLDSAKICTIHSFCLDIIRPNFDRVGLPAKFRTLDDAEVKILKRSVMDELVTDCYDTTWDKISHGSAISFPEFVDCFTSTSGRDESSLIDLFVSVYDELSSFPDNDSFFDRSASSLFASAKGDPFDKDNPFGCEIKEELVSFAGHFQKVFSGYLDIFKSDDSGKAYVPIAAADLSIAERLLNSAENGYSHTRETVNNIAFDKLPPVKSENRIPEFDEYKELRDSFKTTLQKKIRPFFSSSSEGFSRDCERSAEFCLAAGAFLCEFEARYTAAKRRAGAIDYADMEHLTYKLLYGKNGKRSDIAKEVAGRYREIYIDEYQDVNALQDLIFSAVSRPDNRFMVGDIKQSIYSFRGAMPGIFADYRRQFSDNGSNGRVIFMSENFRSDSSVINFSNAVFDTVWQHAGESMDYRSDDRLICGKNGGDTQREKVRILLSDTKADDNDVDTVDEAECIADEIKRLLAKETKSNGEKIQPGDIAIIVRNSKNFAQKFEEALYSAGIPVQNKERVQFFENPEILLMLSLLSAIDNPRQDVYLLSVMMSPLFAFTLDEIAQLRLQSDKKRPLIDSVRECTDESLLPKTKKLTEDLDRYRRMAQGIPSDRLIWQLYRECSVMTFIEKDKGADYESCRANLLALHEYARSYESGGYRGLYSFIKYINGLIATDAKISSTGVDTSKGNSVKIITIHASKGLEFPVCFIAGCGKRYSDADQRASLIFEHDLGAAMKLRIKDHFAKAETAPRRAIANRIRTKAAEEELRVLYVALTRAKERLYVTAAINNVEATLRKAELAARVYDKYSILHTNRYIDLILTAIAVTPCEDCEITICKPGLDETAAELTENKAATAPADRGEVERLKDILGKRISAKYPYAHLKDIPAKVSVSRLYPEMLDAEIYDASEKVSIPELASVPAFLGGESGFAAEAGTATHVFMQFCDFSSIKENGVEAELDRLCEKGFMTDQMAKLVRIPELKKFATSEIFEEMCRAEKIWREQRFNLRLDASLFTGQDSAKELLKGETLLVQGVIDCFFIAEDGKLTLIDYKTDRLTREELDDPALALRTMRSRHGEQLKYYCMALQDIFGRRPDRVLIYSTCLGDTLEI